MPCGRPTRLPPGGRAFSLVELMIAVGILGVGLIFSAALFTTAIKENESSANDAVGTLICKNALAVARVRLRQGDLGTTFGPVPATKLGPGDLAYPVNALPATRGCVALGKRMANAQGKPLDDYLLVFVAYHLDKEDAAAGHVVEARQLGGTLAGGSTEYDVGAGEFNLLQIGSPMIASTGEPAGKYARIVAVSEADGKAYLDRPIDARDVVRPFVVVQLDAGGQPVGRISPAMSLLGSRTGLQK